MTNHNNEKLGIYVHIPFCKSKCYYCSFTSGIFSEDTIRLYFEILPHEFESFFLNSKSYNDYTLYIGGGTPSSVPPDLIKKTVDKLFYFLPLKPNEITVEANPQDISPVFIDTCKALGVTRISIGVQSFNDEVLKFLGRRHTSPQILDSYKILRDNNFQSINIDLIHGIPSFGIERWISDLKTAISLSPEHISLYALSIEEGTQFHKNKIGELIDPDQTADEYHLAVKMLREAGYVRYEISNFAKPKYECSHNLNYWNMGNYIGFGAGSASYIDDVYFERYHDVYRYIECLKKGLSTIVYREEFQGRDKWLNAFIMGMRLESGIKIYEFNQRFGIDIETEVEKEWHDFIDDSHIIIDKDSIRFGDDGIYISNSYLSMLF